jgi:uracil-DNA glycosylase
MEYDSSWEIIFDKYEFNIDSIYGNNTSVFPLKENIFRVFKMDVQDINLVILGQDCYHTELKNGCCIADGYAFSSIYNIPPSLKNIFKEIKNEFPNRNYNFINGDLSKWVENENIFLLNCSLTVEKGKPGSHMEIWKEFTDDIIKYISIVNKECVFVLLGNFAKKKAELILNKDNIINGVHPSPLSANNGFFNSNIFINIEKKLGKEINWQN